VRLPNLDEVDSAATLPSPSSSATDPVMRTPHVAGRGTGARRRPWLLFGAGVLGALLVTVVALLLVRGGEGAEQGTATPFAVGLSPSSQNSGAPTGAPASPAPLLVAGTVLPLGVSQEIAISACGGIRAILTATSIEAQQSGRVILDYVRSVPRVPGVECRLGSLPDAGSSSIILRVTPERGEPFIYPSAGGRGLAVSGAADIYGQERTGAWVFDRVDLTGRSLELVELASDGSEVYRLKLLPR
jgi:hypothetical protein